MQIIADLQLHSKYSRAVSPNMVIPKMFEWNLKKGIGLLATGDWTHPLWIRELKATLDEDGSGLLKLKKEVREQLMKAAGQTGGIYQSAARAGGQFQNNKVTDPLFLLSGEVSCIYSHNGKLRRNHILLFAPSFAVADQINQELVKRGCNLASDGRPILGLSSQEICEVVWGVSEKVMVIPAHVWTPWFSLYGSMSGYDSVEECFGPYSDRICAVETGLSSDPAMNWRIKELDTRSIISNSDAHSGPKLMREATIYEIPDPAKLSFDSILQAIKNYRRDLSLPYIAGTVEFYPEEGKYHYSGHRNCHVRLSPDEVKQKGKICPACGKPMTIGVADRVEDLAGRSVEDLRLLRKPLGNLQISATYSQAFPEKAPYLMLVPLSEIIAEAFGVQSFSARVMSEYDRIVNALGGELAVLIKADDQQLLKTAGEKIAGGIKKVRQGDIVIIPGYDGVFGTVKVWNDAPTGRQLETANQKKQLSLF